MSHARVGLAKNTSTVTASLAEAFFPYLFVRSAHVLIVHCALLSRSKKKFLQLENPKNLCVLCISVVKIDP